MNFIIIKILCTLLVIIMCYFFITETIKYINKKEYGFALIGIVLTIYYLYSEYRLLIEV